MLPPRNQPLGGKITGAGGAQLTPQQVAEQRKVARALMMQAADTSPVGHFTGALTRGLQGYLGGRDMYRANQGEEAGRAAAMDKLSGRGANPVAAALAGGAPSAAPGGGGGFLESLIKSESGGNWGALNNEGYGGRLQFGADRLADAANAGVIPAGVDGAAFSAMSPEQQMAVEQWHFNDIENQAKRMGLDQYLGQVVGGVPVTMEAIKGMAHLGGIGGTARFLQSGGQYNPADSNGTSLRDYGLRHGGAGVGSYSAPGAGNVSQIAALLSDPWVAEVAGPQLQAEMQQQMQMQNAAYQQQLQQQDPLRQLQIQQAQVELQQMQNPASEYDQRAAAADQFGLQGDARQSFILTGNIPGQGAGTPADFQALKLRAEAAGLPEGSPEYKDFMRTAGRATNAMPAAVAALHERALRSGLVEDTPEYENFMLTGGKGVEAGAAVTGKTEAEMALAAPSEVNSADDALLYIDEIRNHPGRVGGTGASSYFMNWIPGSEEYSFANRVKQLGGGAFLTAIAEMQGMGALSNQEGQTAKEAIARLDTAVSEDEFIAALDDYQRIIQRGRDRAAGRINKKDKSTTPAVTPSNTSDESDDDFLKRMGLQ